MRKLSVIAAAAAAVFAATAANAVVAPFGGTATGTDPLGHTWQATNTPAASWGEPGLGAGVLTFNPLNVSSGAGSFANEFDFTFLKGVNGVIDTTPAAGPGGFETTTRFVDNTTGTLWTPVYVSSKQVDFIAPAGTQLNAGDSFFVNVAFTGAVDTEQFSFAGLWTDVGGAGVPEPATWAMMLVGLAGLGAALRLSRRKDGAALAAA